jgi:hypothetical protein
MSWAKQYRVHSPSLFNNGWVGPRRFQSTHNVPWQLNRRLSLPRALHHAWQLSSQCFEAKLVATQPKVPQNTASTSSLQATVLDVVQTRLSGHCIQRELGLLTYAYGKRLVACNVAVRLALHFCSSKRGSVLEITQYSRFHKDPIKWQSQFMYHRRDRHTRTRTHALAHPATTPCNRILERCPS